MIRFQLAGRLGNQLFQWAAALNISNQSNSIEFTFDEYHQSEPSPLLREVANGRFNIRKNNFVGRIFQIEDKYSRGNPSLNKIIYTSYNPYSEVTEVSKKTKILRGYFQNWRNISKNESYIFETLDRAISNRFNVSSKLREMGDELGEFHAVHVRQGDYQHSSFGVLSPDYYAANCIDRQYPVVVFTDSYNLDAKYLNAIEPDFVFSPSELDAEDTFALMSKSKSLVMANSTFSWWAAFMLSQKARLSVIPNYWQKKDESNSALLHPKFKVANSIFN